MKRNLLTGAAWHVVDTGRIDPRPLWQRLDLGDCTVCGEPLRRGPTGMVDCMACNPPGGR